MQEAKLLYMLHCLEEKQRLRKLLNKERLGEQSDFAPFYLIIEQKTMLIFLCLFFLEMENNLFIIFTGIFSL